MTVDDLLIQVTCSECGRLYDLTDDLIPDDPTPICAVCINSWGREWYIFNTGGGGLGCQTDPTDNGPYDFLTAWRMVCEGNQESGE